MNLTIYSQSPNTIAQPAGHFSKTPHLIIRSVLMPDARSLNACLTFNAICSEA